MPVLVPVPVPILVSVPIPVAGSVLDSGHNRVALAQVELYNDIERGHYPFNSPLSFLSKWRQPSHLTTSLPNDFTLLENLISF